MKKIYIQPSTVVAKIAIQSLLTASEPQPKFNPNSNTTVMESRRGTFWDEEDFEDFEDEEDF